MEKSKVYWTDFRTRNGESLMQKMIRLIKKAGIETINFDGKFTAIKTHFGEPGNISYVRHNYSRALVEYIKQLGGKPFLTDCNTLYPGLRKNALDHLDAAYMDGFNPLATGCHVIIGDGLKGTDEAYVDFPEGEFIKSTKVGRAIMDADILISLTHFKLHEATGFGGAIKNIGMGSASRAGKMEQHCDGKPDIEESRCVGCESCARECGQDAIIFYKTSNGEKKAKIEQDICVGCGRCIGACPTDATHPVGDSSFEMLCKKMAEYATAILKNRAQFHISLIVDVSPFCDCHAENDAPVISNVGMFASFDAVAIDQACADMANKQPYLTGTIMDEREHTHSDLFCDVHPETNWKAQITQAEKLGLGSSNYELIKL